MEFKKRTLIQIADMICGNFKPEESFFRYRSSSLLSEFFEDCGTAYRHDGSTRHRWAADTLQHILTEPKANANIPPETFSLVIRTLMDQGDALNEGSERTSALNLLNAALVREGLEAFYAPDKQCYLRHIESNTVAMTMLNPHRPFSQAELTKRQHLINYLDKASEDALIEEILLPLFRQLGFQRVTAAGHKDKALEYGKDIWMKYSLPTLHVLYFGIQAKKENLMPQGFQKL